MPGDVTPQDQERALEIVMGCTEHGLPFRADCAECVLRATKVKAFATALAEQRERVFKDAIAAIEQQRAKYCVYSRDKQPASFCDCKFVVQDTCGENTGCAEMRMAIAAIQLLAGIKPTIGAWLVKEIKADFADPAAIRRGDA